MTITRHDEAPALAEPSSGSRGDQPPAGRTHQLIPASGSPVQVEWQVDQLWSHSSDAGEEWLLIRLARPQNTQISQSPLLHKPSQLLAAAKASLTWTLPPADFVIGQLAEPQPVSASDTPTRAA